ncbi:MAG: TolC family protein [Syntrophobacterales bacterium]|jgi:outer membrane protein
MLRQTTISACAHDAIKWLGTLVVCMTLTLLPQQLLAQENEPVLTLEESIHLALERNMEVQVAKEEIRYAAQGKNRARTGFLPKLKAEYVYRRLSESTTTVGGISSEFADQDQFRFTGTATQPLFTGFETLSTFQLAKLGLDVAKIQLQRTRLDLILSVKETYFEILRAEKISQVAEQSVRQLQEGVRVAQNFVQVGMRPKVDVLDAETRLGEAELQLIVANNDIGVAKARFNTVLRQPIDTKVAVVDVLTTDPYERSYESTQQLALQHRPELLEANKNVDIAEKEITLVKSDYYPDISLSANYYRRGDDPTVDGSDFVDRESWDIVAGATWTFFEWGRTRFATNQQRARLRQAKENSEQIKDSILLEVKTAFLSVQAAEQGIRVAAKSVESAEENFRISQERYKEQVATSSEVLDAQTRLTQARTNYTNALVVFNLARAALVRAMGLEYEPT